MNASSIRGLARRLLVASLLGACGSPSTPAVPPPAAAAPAAEPEAPSLAPSSTEPTSSAASTSSAAPEAPPSSGSATLCGKTVPIKFGLRKDGLFYFDVDVKDRKEGCTGFTVELGEKIEVGKPFTKTTATGHFQKADGNADNAGITGTFTVVVKSFKPTTDWKKPGKCSGEVKASTAAGEKRLTAEVAGEWESECWIPK